MHRSIPASNMGLCQTLVPAALAEPPLPPSRSCRRGPTCRASAAPTVGATGAASKPGEGCPSMEATTEGSSRECEGGCTGEQLAGGFLAYLGQDLGGVECPQHGDNCPLPRLCSAFQLCTSHPGTDGRMEKERPIGELC